MAIYHGEPEVDFDRIKRINRRTHTPMALHGGTGLDEAFARLIARGARKINISTNLKHVFVESFVDYHTAKPKDFEPLRLIDAQYQACKAMFSASSRSSAGQGPRRSRSSPRQPEIANAEGDHLRLRRRAGRHRA